MKEESYGVPVKHVSDTAWMVAYYRAAESQQESPFFRDPFAQMLIADKKELLNQLIETPTYKAIDLWFKWFMFIRTHLIDESIKGVIADGVDTIINLACGLDTRPYRLALPANLRWIEVDYSQVLDYKAKKLSGNQPNCRLERIPLDLSCDTARRAFFDRVSSLSRRVAIITEGLLLYLTPENVESLACDAFDTPSIQYWITEAFDAASFDMWGRWENKEVLAADDVRFNFMPEKFLDFFKPLGWRLDKLWNYEVEGARLQRPRPRFPDETEPEKPIDGLDFGIALLRRVGESSKLRLS